MPLPRFANIPLRGGFRSPFRRILLSLILVGGAFSSGCGGGGGGDNPAGPDTGSNTGSATQATTVSGGFDLLTGGNTATALSSFAAMVSSAASDPALKKQALNGLGWSHFWSGNITDALAQFQAANAIADRVDVNEEIRVGYASALLAAGNATEALSQLAAVAGGNRNFTYLPVHSLGVTNADTHAMYALAALLAGDNAVAKEQKSVAESLDSADSGTATDSIVEGLTNLGI